MIWNLFEIDNVLRVAAAKHRSNVPRIRFKYKQMSNFSSTYSPKFLQRRYFSLCNFPLHPENSQTETMDRFANGAQTSVLMELTPVHKVSRNQSSSSSSKSKSKVNIDVVDPIPGPQPRRGSLEETLSSEERKVTNTQTAAGPGAGKKSKEQKFTSRVQFLSLCFTLFLAGWNDGTTGPLLLRIQEVYHVCLSQNHSTFSN